jgi:anti-sigma factor RsiW
MTDMNRRMEIDLMRLLHGELPAERARELEARLGREPELALHYRRMRQRWEGLALPPPSPVPLGLDRRVMARIASSARESATLSWSLAPTWVRAAAAAALVGGMALGAGLGLLPARGNDAPPGTTSMGERVPLADSYWSVFEDDAASSSVHGLFSSPGGEERP